MEIISHFTIWPLPGQSLNQGCGCRVLYNNFLRTKVMPNYALELRNIKGTILQTPNKNQSCQNSVLRKKERHRSQKHHRYNFQSRELTEIKSFQSSYNGGMPSAGDVWNGKWSLPSQFLKAERKGWASEVLCRGGHSTRRSSWRTEPNDTKSTRGEATPRDRTGGNPQVNTLWPKVKPCCHLVWEILCWNVNTHTHTFICYSHCPFF